MGLVKPHKSRNNTYGIFNNEQTKTYEWVSMYDIVPVITGMIMKYLTKIIVSVELTKTKDITQNNQII
jgi:hypothetical protein